SIEAKKPTRPKLTPITGTSLPRKRCSARNIVPSPPSTTAMSADSRSASGSPTPCFSTSSPGISRSPPASRAIFSSRASAGPIVSRLPCVTTAARRTALVDLGCDSLVDVIGKVRTRAVDKVDEHLPVPLRAGQTGVYDSRRLASPRERGLHRVADDAAPDGDVTHHAALADLGPPGF